MFKKNFSEMPSDFSIDHILNKAGKNRNSSIRNDDRSPDERSSSFVGEISSGNDREKQLPWLQCSRYYPPKIQRIHKKNHLHPQKPTTTKRQLSRHPRIPFTTNQLSTLEDKFKETPYLSSEQVIALSNQLHLADIRVKIWFQNRRARERREKNFFQLNEKRIGNSKMISNIIDDDQQYKVIKEKTGRTEIIINSNNLLYYQ